jgi:hypothetical protein
MNMSEEVKSLQKSVDILSREMVEVKQLLLNQTPTGMIEEEIIIDEQSVNDADEPKPITSYNNLDIAKSYRREYKYSELNDKFKFVLISNGRHYTSNFTIFDVMILKNIEFEKEWKKWNELSSLIGVDMPTIKVLCFNIVNGFFDEFLKEFSINFSKEYGLLYINQKKTNTPIRTVRYIVNCMVNSSKPMQTLFKLEKTKECSKLVCRIIGTHYTNNELNSLLTENQVAVENNPQKRKEKGL